LKSTPDPETRQVLLELRTALRRLNPKRLSRYAYISRIGDWGSLEYCMCSLGALRVHLTHKGMVDQEVLQSLYKDPSAYTPHCFVWSDIYDTIVNENDEFVGTEEQRYTHMLRWVNRRLKALSK
jgi:hypothetical protein